MTWSYDPAAIEKGLNRVRLLVGDTYTNDQQISDEEINSLLAMESNVYLVAAQIADAISAKYRRYGAADESKRFEELAVSLQIKAGVDYL